MSLHDQVQKLRVAQGNRVRAATEAGKTNESDIHGRYFDVLHSLEKDIDKQYKAALGQHPAWPWLQQIRGVGHGLAAGILAEIDFEAAPTVSALWRYAGLAVVDGKRERPVKGVKLTYNKVLKKRMYLFAVGQLRSSGPYGPMYYSAKQKYTDREATKGTDGWTKLHIHYAALRIPSKLFLSHLWAVSRDAFGLSTEGPWIKEFGGDVKELIDPWFMKEESAVDKP